MPKTQQTVLVLEGAADFREALDRGLSDSGTIVHAAGTWEAADRLLERLGSAFSLAILDPDLPGAVPRDASRFPTLPNGRWPVFLTCESPPTPEQIAEAHRRGIIGYLHRQADMEEILLRVNAYLEGRLVTSHAHALRVRVLACVEMCSSGSQDGDPVSGLLRNISRTGMLLSMISPPALGTKIRLSFQLPSRTTQIRCNGRVVWLQSEHGPGGPDAGIEFEDLQPDDAEFLHRFVLERLRTGSGPLS